VVSTSSDTKRGAGAALLDGISGVMTQPFELAIRVFPETARCEPRETPRKVNDSKPFGLKPPSSTSIVHLIRARNSGWPK